MTNFKTFGIMKIVPTLQLEIGLINTKNFPEKLKY